MSQLSSWVGGRAVSASSTPSSRTTTSAGPGRPIRVTIVSPTPQARCGSPTSRSSARSACRKGSRPRATHHIPPDLAVEVVSPNDLCLRGRAPRSSNTSTRACRWSGSSIPRLARVHIYRRDGSISLASRGRTSSRAKTCCPASGVALAAIFPGEDRGQTGNRLRSSRLEQGWWRCAESSVTPGGHQAAPILVGGLRRLEYRGYDSAGPGDHRPRPARSCASGPAGCGSWRNCSSASRRRATCGISHTRWATHGPATDRNAHPHLGGRAGDGHGRRRAQRRDREPRRAAPRARVAGLRVRQPDRHRGHRPPDRPRAGDDRRPVRGRAARLAAAGGDLRAGGRQPEAARRGRSVPGSAARWSSAWARASTCWPATRWRSRPTRRGSRSCRTARSSA